MPLQAITIVPKINQSVILQLDVMQLWFWHHLFAYIFGSIGLTIKNYSIYIYIYTYIVTTIYIILTNWVVDNSHYYFSSSLPNWDPFKSKSHVTDQTLYFNILRNNFLSKISITGIFPCANICIYLWKVKTWINFLSYASISKV